MQASPSSHLPAIGVGAQPLAPLHCTSRHGLPSWQPSSSVTLSQSSSMPLHKSAVAVVGRQAASTSAPSFVPSSSTPSSTSVSASSSEMSASSSAASSGASRSARSAASAASSGGVATSWPVVSDSSCVRSLSKSPKPGRGMSNFASICAWVLKSPTHAVDKTSRNAAHDRTLKNLVVIVPSVCPYQYRPDHASPAAPGATDGWIRQAAARVLRPCDHRSHTSQPRLPAVRTAPAMAMPW